MALAFEQLTNTKIALFYDPAYVGTGGTLGDEGSEVKASLEDLGHSVKTFAGTDIESWANALEGVRVLHIPMLRAEPTLSEGAKLILKLFVSQGGTVVFHSTYQDYGDQKGADLINKVFKTQLDEIVNTTSSSATSATSGTTFAGITPLPDNDGTDAIAKGSLPSFAEALFTNASGDATVAGFQYGLGQVIYLGWDSYNSLPAPGVQNSAWQNVLQASTSLTDGNPNGVTIHGTSKNDSVSKKFDSTDFDDIFYGGKGNDKAFMRGGSDVLLGEKGKDKLYGEAGDDFISGGKDKDKLWGGDGGDYFLFDVKVNKKKADKIFDYDEDEDMMVLYASYFPKLSLGEMTSSDFGKYIDYGSNGVLKYDGKKFAKLQSGSLDIDQTDFVIIDA